MKHRLLVGLVALLLSAPAFAQGLPVVDYSVTLGTTAVPCVPANAGRRTLSIENPYGGSNNVCYSTGTPVCGAAGTSVLVPGALDYWANGSAPAGPVNCIASAGSTPVTIKASPQ
jgi:hypothetical protein